MRKRVELKAIYDEDLEHILANLGILNKIIAGELNCVVCGCLVDLDNLGTIFTNNDEIGVSCDNDRCIRMVTTRGMETFSD